MQGNSGGNQSNLDLAMISHELRNALCGSAGLAQQLVTSELTPGQLSLVRALQQTTRHMRWLVDALGQEGSKAQFPLSPRLASLHGIELLEHLIRSHAVPAIAKNILLLLTIGPEVPSIWRCDKRLLRLVLENLLGNAIKYGGAGEIALEVEAVDAGLEIRVWDNGPGIDAQAQARMFEPGVRCGQDGSDTDGEGLGLYLCQCIMSRLDGSVVYAANGKKGSCFTLTLPRVLPTLARQPGRPASSLFQSVVCVLSLPSGLSGSLLSILTRLGVSRVVTAREDLAEVTAKDCVVEMTERRHLAAVGGRNGALMIAPHECGDGQSRTARPRSVPFPVLESSLGPVLMELALEHRMSRSGRNRISPATGGMQGSVPTRR